ncbi:MAG: cbb3-type cytochrome c oxidase subunit 3 [Pseudomonadota bacterium]
MDTYTLLRAFADSWFLILMTAFFLGIVFYTLRPGARAKAHYQNIAEIPLRDHETPIADPKDKETHRG